MDKMMNASKTVAGEASSKRVEWSANNFVEKVVISNGSISEVQISGKTYDEKSAMSLLIAESTGTIKGSGDCEGWELTVAREGLSFKHV